MEPDQKKLAELDALVEESEAAWVDEVEQEAKWPESEAFSSRDAYFKRLDLFNEFLTGRESRQIARIIFQLKAHDIGTVEAMQALIERHNESLQRDYEDVEYAKRTGLNAERLRQAAFQSEEEKQTLLHAVALHGAGVLHKSGFWRLLVRHTNQNRVNQALEILKEAGFLSMRKGPNNSDIFHSDGRLEAAHVRYLERISKAAMEAKGD